MPKAKLPRLSNYLPKGNPVKDAISDVRQLVDAAREEIRAVADTIRVAPRTEHSTPPVVGVPPELPTSKVGACLDCWRNHLITVSGALTESLRFAREEGIRSAEVANRLMIALSELDIGERIDSSPEKVAKLPPKQKEIMDWLLPRQRALRHDIEAARTVPALEKAAASAESLSREFFMKLWQCEPCAFAGESLHEYVKRKGRSA